MGKRVFTTEVTKLFNFFGKFCRFINQFDYFDRLIQLTFIEFLLSSRVFLFVLELSPSFIPISALALPKGDYLHSRPFYHFQCVIFWLSINGATSFTRRRLLLR